MSTLKATNLQHPSAASPNVVMGSTGSVAVAGALTGAGMDLVNKTDFSAVTAVSLNNVFTSAYDNYLIVSSSFNMSASIGLQLRLRAAGSDSTATEYNVNYVTFSNAAVSSNASTYARFYLGSFGNVTKCGLSVQLFSPALSVQTTAIAHGNSTDAAAQSALMTGTHRLTTSYDGFTLYPESGTITGTIRVYGYRNS